MNLLIDMNLSPSWVSLLTQAGHAATHWSSVGSPSAKDSEILTWAREQQQIVFTHDLDFGAILAATNADSPSVLQVRTQDPTPENCGKIVIDILGRHATALREGSLISVDENRARVRLLPFNRHDK